LVAVVSVDLTVLTLTGKNPTGTFLNKTVWPPSVITDKFPEVPTYKIAAPASGY
jgi:hypothetical protein